MKYRNLVAIGGPAHGQTLKLPSGQTEVSHCGIRYTVGSWRYKGKLICFLSDSRLSTEESVIGFVDHFRRLES